MKIRRGKIADLNECIKIGKVPELHYLYKSSDKMAKRYLKEYIVNGYLVLAEENGKIAGFISGEPMRDNHYWIDALVVKKEM